MTEILIQYIELAAVYAGQYGLLLIFIFMTVESSFIPFPSEVVMIPAGFLAARGALTLVSPETDAVLAVLAGTAGSLAGAYFNYYLSSWLGRPFLDRYGRYFFLPPASLKRAEEIFLKYGAGATFVCRLLPGIRQLISIPAGITRMRHLTFALCTGIGAGLWVIVLTVIGFTLGATTAEMSYADIVHRGKDMIGENLIWILVACGVFFAGYVYTKNRIMRSSAPTAS